MAPKTRINIAGAMVVAFVVVLALCVTPWGRRDMQTTAPIGAAQRATADESFVLEGVPRVGYNVRLCPFPGSLESVMKYMDQPADYDTLMAVTGGAFRRFYNKDDGGNVSLEYLAPEVYQRAFWSMGYDYRLLKRLPRESRPEAMAANRDEILKAIRQSVMSGRPVLAGVAGPECGVVAGYDRGGDALLGWSYFKETGDSYYHEDRWYESMGGAPYCIILGEKHARPNEREVLIATLEWAISLERRAFQPTSPDHVCGLAAYDAWASQLENDAEYPADKPEVLQTRAMIQVDQVVMVADRGSGVKYLRQAATIAPEAAEPLNRAADLLDEAQHPKTQLWRWGKWQDPAAGQGMADPALRRELAAAVRGTKEKEAAAVEQMEKALDILSPVPESAALKTPTSEDLMNGGARWQVENVPLSVALRAALNVLGDDMGKGLEDGWSTDHAYDISMVYSGLAFESCVHISASDRKQADYKRISAAVIQNEYQRSLEAVGRSGEVLVRPDDGKTDNRFAKAAIQSRIVQAIGRCRRPVILECLPKMRRDVPGSSTEPGSVCLITGYERGGEVLTGWTTNWGGPSILFEPDKQKQFANWFDDTMAVVITGEK